MIYGVLKIEIVWNVKNYKTIFIFKVSEIIKFKYIENILELKILIHLFLKKKKLALSKNIQVRGGNKVKN